MFRVASPLEWLVSLCSHIPNRGEQMVRYYGHYSNVSRGKRQKEGSDETIPCILEPQWNEKIFRRNWARLIQMIGACPREGGESRSPGHLAGPVQAAAENPVSDK